MNEIAYLFRRGRGFFSRLISWSGVGYHGYSHVDLRFSNGDLCGARDDKTHGFDNQILQPGIRERPWNYEKVSALVLATKACSLTEYNAWRAAAIEHIGDGYDSEAIVGFVTGLPLSEGAGFEICSAFGTMMEQKRGNFPQPLPFADSQISPNMLLMGLAVTGFNLIYDPPQYRDLLP